MKRKTQLEFALKSLVSQIPERFLSNLWALCFFHSVEREQREETTEAILKAEAMSLGIELLCSKCEGATWTFLRAGTVQFMCPFPYSFFFYCVF